MTTNNETKCGIIYEKIAMWADDNERMMSGLKVLIKSKNYKNLVR